MFFIHRIINKSRIINKFVIKSVYYDYHYELNKTYRNDELILEQSRPNEPEFVAFVDEGFHSYDQECKCIIEPMGLRDWKNLSIVSSNKDHLNDNILCKNVKKMNCVIPKGSVYCENEHGEIVSDRLKPVSIEEL